MADRRRSNEPGERLRRLRKIFAEAYMPGPNWWVAAVALYVTLLYLSFTTDGFSVLWAALLVVAVVFPLVFSGQINGYKPDERTPADLPRVWHSTNAPELMSVAAGDVIVLDPRRCRFIARMWSPNTLGLPKRAVYVFDRPPTPAGLTANVTRKRRGVVLELDAHGLAGPWHRRGSAIAAADRPRSSRRLATAVSC